MQPYILGVDIGTGSTKSIAVTAKGEAFSVMKFTYPVNHPQQGFSEQNPQLIWLAFTNSILQHIEKLQHPPLAICLSSVMHGVIPVDKNGVALHNMITWADARSETIAERIRHSSLAGNLYRRTGTPIHAMSPLCKIIWLKENNEALFNQSHKFISIKEFIWFKLFNEFKIDISVASATGLFNIITNKWDEDALQMAGINEDKLSLVVSSNYVSEIFDTNILNLLKIPPGVPFIIGASDGGLATFASHLTANVASITIGTSGAVRTINKKPVYNFNAMTFNYKLFKDTFICGGAINNGGNVLQWLLTLFEKGKPTDADYEELFANIDKVKPGANGLLFLPYLNGERAPHWDTKSCGSFFGIRQHHKKYDFARAAIEGVCYALNDVLLTLQEGGQQINRLHVSGGFVSSKSWMQILADITGKEIQLFQTDDASAIGAAYLGLQTLGLADENILQSDKETECIKPDLEHYRLYKSYFKIFKTLYPALKDSMHQLHNLHQK